MGSLTEHLFTYALGRPIDYYDIATVHGVVKKTEADNYRFSTLITEIVKFRVERTLERAKARAKVPPGRARGQV